MKYLVEMVKAYKTSDGKVFEDITDAERHQERLDLATRLDNSPLFGNVDGSRVEANDLEEWLIANADVVRAVVK